MALPNPGMDAVPFTPLTAEFLDDMIENIESLSDGTGFETGAITTNTLADNGVTATKISLSTLFSVKHDTTNVSTLTGLKIQSGWGQFLGNNTTSQTASVTFPTAFTTTPYCVIIKLNGYKESGTFATLKDINNGIGPQFEASTSAISNSGLTASFSGTISFGPAYHAFSWIAIGI